MQKKFPEPSSWPDLYGDYLYNYAISRVFQADLAKDLVQETFLSALKAIGSFRGKSSMKTWLISILRNKIIDHFRKPGNSKMHNTLDDEKNENFISFVTEGPDAGKWTDESTPALSGFDMEKAMETDEFLGILQKCLANLPPRWAAVFTLKEIEDLETKEICKEINISPSNFWVILHRARTKLRDCLEKNWLNK